MLMPYEPYNSKKFLLHRHAEERQEAILDYLSSSNYTQQDFSMTIESHKMDVYSSTIHLDLRPKDMSFTIIKDNFRCYKTIQKARGSNLIEGPAIHRFLYNDLQDLVKTLDQAIKLESI